MGQKIKQFEDLVAWQKARALTATIYKTTAQGSFVKDYTLTDQIRRAAVSVMPNVAEGFERRGAAEFARFVLIAKASCAELRSQLYIALDVGYISEKLFSELSTQAIEVARILGGLHASLLRDRDQSSPAKRR
ncbi:MAG: four helix bundle protein [Candidatus Hydrogenedentes bacterium]|nr:four helix bundle protein [Candidatus Hydrogenedentota bacterium]